MSDDAEPFDVCVAFDLDEAAQERQAELLQAFAGDLVRMLQRLQAKD